MTPIKADRAPISTYAQACWWLIGEWLNKPSFLDDSLPLPAEGRLVCDIFWVTDRILRDDVRKMWNELFHEQPGVVVLPRRVVL